MPPSVRRIAVKAGRRSIMPLSGGHIEIETEKTRIMLLSGRCIETRNV